MTLAPSIALPSTDNLLRRKNKIDMTKLAVKFYVLFLSDLVVIGEGLFNCPGTRSKTPKRKIIVYRVQTKSPGYLFSPQSPVVQRADNFIQRIKRLVGVQFIR